MTPGAPARAAQRARFNSTGCLSPNPRDLGTRGAHLLLQIGTRVLNDTPTLTDDYRRWYHGFTHTDRQTA